VLSSPSLNKVVCHWGRGIEEVEVRRKKRVLLHAVEVVRGCRRMQKDAKLPLVLQHATARYTTQHNNTNTRFTSLPLCFFPFLPHSFLIPSSSLLTCTSDVQWGVEVW
jgi:hypothetical protein